MRLTVKTNQETKSCNYYADQAVKSSRVRKAAASDYEQVCAGQLSIKNILQAKLCTLSGEFGHQRRRPVRSRPPKYCTPARSGPGIPEISP